MEAIFLSSRRILLSRINNNAALVRFTRQLPLRPRQRQQQRPYSSCTHPTVAGHRPSSKAEKMTIRAAKFTPEVMISAPRRSAGVPNEDASLILHSTSSYSFGTRETTTEVRMLDVKSGESSLLDDSGKLEVPVWIRGSTVAALRSIEHDKTELVVGDVHDFKESVHVAGVIDAPASHLKVTPTDEEDCFGIAVTIATNADGTMHRPQPAKAGDTTGKLYSSLFVRHWDTWVKPERSAIWYGTLCASTGGAKSYEISPLLNALEGTALESPIPPFGGEDHFDISKYGIIFIAKDPDLDPALNTKCNVYLKPLRHFGADSPSKLLTIDMGEYKGAMASPKFSNDGKKAVFLVMRRNSYESDKNQVILIPDTSKPNKIQHLFKTKDGKGAWDRSPSSVVFSHDGSKLFFTVENEGCKLLYSYGTLAAESNEPAPLTPAMLTLTGAVGDVKPLPSSGSSERVFLTSTSLVDSSSYSILDVKTGGSSEQETAKHVNISSVTNDGNLFGLSSKQVSHFWFPASSKGVIRDNKAQAWMMVPSTFDKSKKYPLAFVIHGGPQDAWGDSWTVRWNAAIYAEQGYVVVLPNPTGSTGYGQDFTDHINQNWGGSPYKDLESCFSHIEQHFDFVDTARAVALGASYGGYMINWIQGHPLGRKFKALVCHDGIFSVPFSVATDELYFVNHDNGGDWSHAKDNWNKWSPAEFTKNWKTPQLVIHNDNDFRLTMADGLAAFNILQSQGIESQLLSFPDENHWVQKPENSLIWHEAVLTWINKHVDLPPYKEDDLKRVIMDPPRHVDGSSRVIEKLTPQNV